MAILDKILIAVVLIISGLAGIFYYQLSNSKAQIELLNAQVIAHQLTIENQSILIQGLELTNKLTRDVISMREAEVKRIESELEAIGIDLGDDEEDLAPASTRELIRRLQSK